MTTEQTLVQCEVRIAASPQTVYSFFTDPQKMLRWKGIAAELDPRPGGVYRVEMNSNDVALGSYVELEPYSRIVIAWGWEGNDEVPPGSSIVEVTLDADGDGTILRLTHRDLPAPEVEKHNEGWTHYLARLEIAASGGEPGADPFVAAAPELSAE